GGAAKAGDAVVVTIGGKEYPATVQPGNTWSVTVPADAVKDLQPGDIMAEVTGKDQYGNAYDADTSRDYDVQTETPVATIEIDQPMAKMPTSAGNQRVITSSMRMKSARSETTWTEPKNSRARITHSVAWRSCCFFYSALRLSPKDKYITMANPLTAMVMYLSLGESLSAEEKKQQLRQATLCVILALLVTRALSSFCPR
ncbi:hemagglutinin/hemolysin-like protein, partial [Alcaligenes faecalis subsp. faecalis NCIB 8687]